jgi:hypothetical protein
MLNWEFPPAYIVPVSVGFVGQCLPKVGQAIKVVYDFLGIYLLKQFIEIGFVKKLGIFI